MAEMKDSGIEWVGKIPENWRVLKNKYNFELSKEIIGTKWVETQLLSLTKYGIKAINDGEQTGKVPASLSTYQKVNKDDLVMCLFDLDCSAVFSGISDFDGMVSPAYKCIKCKAHLFPKYIDYYFRTVFVDRKYKRYSKNVRFSISADEFMNLPIIVPPKDMQINIAKFLDKKCAEVDALHTDIEKQIETLEEYKKSIITEAVTKGLDPDVEMKDSGIEWIGMIPKNWSVTRMQEIGTYKKGPFGSAITKNMFVEKDDNTYKVYEQKNAIYKNVELGYYYIPFSIYKRLKEFAIIPQDIIVSCAGTIGECYIMPNNMEKGIINQALMRIRLKENINKNYFIYVFDIVLTYANLKYSNGSAMKNIPPFSVLKKLGIPLPSVQEQEKIANYLDDFCNEIDGVIVDKKKQLETLEQYKKSLIHEYVTGKKEVK